MKPAWSRNAKFKKKNILVQLVEKIEAVLFCIVGKKDVEMLGSIFKEIKLHFSFQMVSINSSGR